MRAFDLAAKQLWAIRSQMDDAGNIEAPELRLILDVAQRAHQPDFEAVAQKMADRADAGGILEMRGPVAVVNINGPIFRYANLFTMISGATSVQELASAFRKAVDDPKAAAIVLNIDSPGGEVAGISELAQAIYEARSSKPIVAYADDLTASAAYWLASAASKIVASDTAELGSIGVVATIVQREDRPGAKTYQFVSSVSPRKRPDLNTDEGRATIQQRIDDTAAVFVAAVAKYRGVSEAKVLSDFGQGGVFIASKAVAAGMADQVGTFEPLLASLAAEQSPLAKKFVFGGSAANSTQGGLRMENPTNPAEKTAAEGQPKQPPVDVAAVKAETIKTERSRINAILGCDEANGREQLARTLALETDTDAETAKKLLAAAPKQAAAAPANPLAAAMSKVDNPKVGADKGGEETTAADEVRMILAFTGQKEGK